MSSDDLAQPTQVIAKQLAEWEIPYVDLAIFETAEPLAIARAVDAFCREQLGARITEYLFCNASIGSVHGVVLDDGRRVVVKAQQPDKSLAVLREVVRTQMHLASRSLYAPSVLAGPAPLGLGHATIEELVDGGSTADAHRPEIRRALAFSLYEISSACRPLVSSSELAPHGLSALPQEQLWPRPHSKLFDFDATQAGADYIERQSHAPLARGCTLSESLSSATAIGGRSTCGVHWGSTRCRFRLGQSL